MRLKPPVPTQVQRRVRRFAPETTDFFIHGRAFQNAELLPYVDGMWTAEGIDFTKSPAYWLISIASLPFGSFGEMLGADTVPPVPGTWCGESCANKWRGMLFGMSNQCGWNGADPNDNKGLWALWDDVKISQADMYGWWNASAPVKTNSSDVLATAYSRYGNLALVALASWSGKNETVALTINFTALGLDEATTKLTAPALKSYNRHDHALTFDAPVAVVPPYQGWLLVLS